MNFNPYDIHDFDITMNNLIENREEGTLVGIHIYDTSKEYNLKIIEKYLENPGMKPRPKQSYYDLYMNTVQN